MVKLFIISAFAFTIGNVLWDKFGMDDPRIFYIPLAFLLLMGSLCAKKLYSGKDKRIEYCLKYVITLSIGNIVKQIWYYSYDIKQFNDYVFGITATLILIIVILWETLKRHGGKKLGKV